MRELLVLLDSTIVYTIVGIACICRKKIAQPAIHSTAQNSTCFLVFRSNQTLWRYPKENKNNTHKYKKDKLKRGKKYNFKVDSRTQKWYELIDTMDLYGSRREDEPNQRHVSLISNTRMLIFMSSYFNAFRFFVRTIESLQLLSIQFSLECCFCHFALTFCRSIRQINNIKYIHSIDWSRLVYLSVYWTCWCHMILMIFVRVFIFGVRKKCTLLQTNQHTHWSRSRIAFGCLAHEYTCHWNSNRSGLFWTLKTNAWTLSSFNLINELKTIEMSF